MRFSVRTDSLKRAIDIVGRASVSAGMTPILENILIAAQFKKVVLTANNLEMAIEYAIEDNVTIEREGSFTVSAKFLSSFVGLVHDETISIELVSGGSLELRTASSETKIKGMDASNFPVLPGFRKSEAFSMKGSELKRAIDYTLFSVAEGNIRPTLAGIYMNVAATEIAFASTDSFRLSEYTTQHEKSEEPAQHFIMPAKTASELGRIVNEDSKVELYAGDGQLLAIFDGIRLFSRLLNGHFPDYNAFFPQNHRTRAVVRRNDLATALKRVNLIARQNNSTVRFRFTAESGIDISTGETEIGAAAVRVGASIEGEDNTVGLNATFLLEALNVIPEDYVVLEFETSLSPVVVRGTPDKKGHESFRHLIMPLKV